ncbi:MAG: GNAT family N-acetyltransferase [Candidatus Staskawiczbacteria bacterium]|nr:GNAT family N-acetyltransferase [Candidatus Staskawiczbacteria bacterium]
MITKTFGEPGRPGKKLIIESLGPKELKYAKEYTDFINSLIAENAKILMNRKQTVKEETEFVKGAIKKTKEKKKIYLIAKDGKKVVANTSFEVMAYKQNHIARFGIAIRNGYRGMGLGNYMMTEVMKLAKTRLKPTPKLFRLEVLENNKPAIALYKKMGFKIVAKLPKHIQDKGKLVAEYVMIKDVK